MTPLLTTAVGLMFTGIIECQGKIATIKQDDSQTSMTVESDAFIFDSISIGDSISVNGVCLTVSELSTKNFSAVVSKETLDCTTIGLWTVGTIVNLEHSVTPTTFLGGHIVTGHIDGVAVVTNRYNEGSSICLTFSVPDHLSYYIATKGSVCLNGVSLTVNNVTHQTFKVNIIPHTQEVTNFTTLMVGDVVNLEVDVVSRYCERLLQRQT